MGLTFHQGIAAGEVAIYVPALLIAGFLTYKHGLGKSAGWYFLIVFSLARVLGGSTQLATINDPKNIGLLTATSILTNIGFSPLTLATLGLLSRLVESINKTQKNMHFSFSTKHLKTIEFLMTIALILGIVGGVNAGNAASKSPTGAAPTQTLSKVATAIFIVCYIATVLSTIITSLSISHAEEGEKRLLLAISLSLPFLAIRLIYSCIATFTTNKHFSLLTGSAWILLFVALLPELVVVVFYETTGLTLRAIPKDVHGNHQAVGSVSSADHFVDGPAAPKQDNVFLRIAKRTIIGRLVMAFIPSTKEKRSDVEMVGGQHYQK